MEFSSCVQLDWDVQRDEGRSPAEIEVCVEEQELSSPTRTVRGRVPGRDHWRNYQERWRLEYLMDYDQGRHGLVCMVCGSALATLKLSTIKRHILQKHQKTMDFTLAEKVMVVEEWNKKIAAIAKMDFWQVPSDGNGFPRQHHPGVIISSQH
ncbi:zinc finger translocation-associated protein-like [Mustelus asterias]